MQANGDRIPTISNWPVFTEHENRTSEVNLRAEGYKDINEESWNKPHLWRYKGMFFVQARLPVQECAKHENRDDKRGEDSSRAPSRVRRLREGEDE